VFGRPAISNGHCPTRPKKAPQPCLVEKLKSSFAGGQGWTRPKNPTARPCPCSCPQGSNRPLPPHFPPSLLSLTLLNLHFHRRRPPLPPPMLASAFPADTGLHQSATTASSTSAGAPEACPRGAPRHGQRPRIASRPRSRRTSSSSRLAWSSSARRPAPHGLHLTPPRPGPERRLRLTPPCPAPHATTASAGAPQGQRHHVLRGSTRRPAPDYHRTEAGAPSPEMLRPRTRLPFFSIYRDPIAFFLFTGI
jgi:hypothetical protein